jgi:cobyric acid synthase
VIGVVPWIADLNLPDEDSLSSRTSRAARGSADRDRLAPSALEPLDLEPSLDRLADVVRASLNMDAVRGIAGIAGT